MKNIKFGLAVLLAAMFAASCTIDARGGPNDDVSDDDDATDGGSDDDSDAGDDDAVGENEFEVAYTAPENATAVTLCSNFSGSWVCGTATSGRTTTWNGDLDLRRLGLPACTAHAVGQDCGYVWNVSFDVPPFWAATQALDGNLSVVGEPDVSGPVPVEAVAVENGLDGANLHLRRAQ